MRCIRVVVGCLRMRPSKSLVEDGNGRHIYIILTALASSIPSVEGYSKNGLTLNFDFDRSTSSPDVTITVTAANSGTSELTDFVFQAAVPKSFQLNLQPPSGNTVAAFGMGTVSQRMVVKNPNRVSEVAGWCGMWINYRFIEMKLIVNSTPVFSFY